MARNTIYLDTNASRAGDRIGYDVRHIGLRDIYAAWRSGVDDFSAHPTQKVFSWLIYPVLGIVMLRAASERSLLPLLFPLISGIALVSPLLAVGLNEISRQREHGHPISHAQAFNVFGYPARGTILLLGAILAALFFAWLATAMILFRMTIGATPESWSEFASVLFTTREGWTLIVLGNIAGFAFAAIVFALSAVSFPLIIDRHANLRGAVLTSVDAIVHNPGPMAVWGIVIAALLMLGSLPALMGLAVVIPILGHTTWHIYRKVVV